VIEQGAEKERPQEYFDYIHLETPAAYNLADVEAGNDE